MQMGKSHKQVRNTKRVLLITRAISSETRTKAVHRGRIKPQTLNGLSDLASLVSGCRLSILSTLSILDHRPTFSLPFLPRPGFPTRHATAQLVRDMFFYFLYHKYARAIFGRPLNLPIKNGRNH